MTQEEMRKRFDELYRYMASSENVAYMRTFGKVHKDMMEWMISNKPDMAQDYIERLESIMWNNYLTRKEADRVVAELRPNAPWSRDQWEVAMTQHGYETEESPCYNKCALFAVMNMIHSESMGTLSKHMGDADVFDLIHGLAIDKLKGSGGRFNVRTYFGL